MGGDGVVVEEDGGTEERERGGRDEAFRALKAGVGCEKRSQLESRTGGNMAAHLDRDIADKGSPCPS